MTDGQLLEILHPRLAINGGGTGFIGPDGGLNHRANSPARSDSGHLMVRE